MLSYKETLRSTTVDDEISFSAFAETCDCESFLFRNKHHGHIVTGDLSKVPNAGSQQIP